jgi:hypothetical protein
MKRRGLLLGGLAVIVATACSHRVEPPPPSIPLVTSPSSTPEATVPLPAQTPYDGKAQTLALYRENYARGYSSASSDYASPGCLCTAGGDTELYEAAMNGFFAGRDAGAAAWARKQRPAPVEGTPAPGTSAAKSPAPQK